MDKGHADPKALITSMVPLADLPATFDTLRGPNNETKVHVSPDGDMIGARRGRACVRTRVRG